MLKIKSRITAPLGMGLLFMSLTAIPLSLAFHVSKREMTKDTARSAPPGVNDMIGPWWPFAYVLDKDAVQLDTPDPVAAPGCETHIAENSASRWELFGDSCGRRSFRPILDDCDMTDTAPEDCAKTSPATPEATAGPMAALNRQVRKSTRSQLVAKTLTVVSKAPESHLSIIAARELKECLLKLAILVKDLRFPEDAGLALSTTPRDCDDADAANTTEGPVEADTDKAEEPKKIRREPVPPEEVCYPELLGEPEADPQP